MQSFLVNFLEILIFFEHNSRLLDSGAITIVGLVDVILTETDPDYHWTDSFRTYRSSNEASQRILNQLTCRLRRLVARKTSEMGGNTVLSFRQKIDIESYTQTISVRGIGTAAHCEFIPVPIPRDISNLEPIHELENTSDLDPEISLDTNFRTSRKFEFESISNNFFTMRLPKTKRNSQLVELCTISRAPESSIIATAGIVASKSVRLMSEEVKEGGCLSAQSRDRWLGELRQDVRSHARSLGCNVVLGYSEAISIQDDIYVLYAEGTACRMRHQRTIDNISLDDDSRSSTIRGKLQFNRIDRQYLKKNSTSYGGLPSSSFPTKSLPLRPNSSLFNGSAADDEEDSETATTIDYFAPSTLNRPLISDYYESYLNDINRSTKLCNWKQSGKTSRSCQALHLPKERYFGLNKRQKSNRRKPEDDGTGPDLCRVCGRGRVAEMILATIDIPSEAEVLTRRGQLIEAYICRPLRRSIAIETKGGGLENVGNSPTGSITSSIGENSNAKRPPIALSDGKIKAGAAAVLVSANLPFAEHELYRQLQFKMRHYGLNGLFGVRYHWHANERMIIGVASGTGVCLAALPLPRALYLTRTIAIRDAEDERIFKTQERIALESDRKHDIVRAAYEVRFPSESYSDDSSNYTSSSSSSASEFELRTSELSESSSDSSDSESSSASSMGEAFIEIDDEADEDLLLTLEHELDAEDLLIKFKGTQDHLGSESSTEFQHDYIDKLNFSDNEEKIKSPKAQLSGVASVESDSNNYQNSALDNASNFKSTKHVNKEKVSTKDCCDENPSHQIDPLEKSHYVCLFRRFSLEETEGKTSLSSEHHPNSLLASQFIKQYDQLYQQCLVLFGYSLASNEISRSGEKAIANIDSKEAQGDVNFFVKDLNGAEPYIKIHSVRHQLNLIRGVELQILTTATVLGRHFQNNNAIEPRAATANRKIQSSPMTNGIVPRFKAGKEIFIDKIENRGFISVQLFKEIPYYEAPGGFGGFVSGTMAELLGVARASADSLGPDSAALTEIAFQPAAFYENFKNQLHAVLHLTANVMVKIDYESSSDEDE